MEGRGSDKLSDLFGQDVGALAEDDIRQLVGITRDSGYKVLGWWIYGQPRPDWLGGLVRVELGRASEVVQALLAVERLRLRLDVFPLGIPFPDEALIGFRTRRLALPQDPDPV
jgi:hypothetical protein